MTKMPIAVLALLMCGCHHPHTLPQSLATIFSDHLRGIDSAATLDSVQVHWKVAIDQKHGRIFDDSIYVREYTRVKAQLAEALPIGNKDSIEFYEYEIHYMEQEIDSIGRSIPLGDTTHSFGTLVGTSFYIRKNNKFGIDSTLVFIDTASTVRFTEFLDSALRRTVKTLQAP